MSHLRTANLTKLALWLLVLSATLLLLDQVSLSSRKQVSYLEAKFTDASPYGLQIMPASCASNPADFHGFLASSPDGRGYILPPGAGEDGAYAPFAGMYVCANNTTANTFFIPANTAAELQSFKNYPPYGVRAY
jgi:hypothetical protein